ncbi:MAG: metallophosphoesterase [Planctomycetota bacterium]
MGLSGDAWRRRWSRCARAVAGAVPRASALAGAIGVWTSVWIGTSVVTWLTVLVLWRDGGAAGLSPIADGALKSVGNTSEVAFLPARALAIIALSFTPEPFASSGGLRERFLYHLIAWGIVLGSVGVALLAARGVVRAQRSGCSPERRRFLRVGLGSSGALAAASGALGAYATLVEPSMVRTTRYRVPIAGLPRSLDGLRIVQISDTHLGRRVTEAHIARAVRIAIDLKPDIFALTGDYVSGGPELHKAATALLRPLAQTGRPVVSVLGNHDWFHDGRDMTRRLRAHGLNPIDNARVFLTADRRLTIHPARGSLALAGVGDLKWDRVDFNAALVGVPASMPRVLLSHQPDVAEFDPAGHRVDLMLSGHTHGGQVRVPGLGSPIVPSRYGDRYAYGLVRGPWCPVVINAGVGTSILPIRFGMPPEVTEITLVRADA